MIDYASGKTVGKIWDYRVSASSNKNFITFEGSSGNVVSYTYGEFDLFVNKLMKALASQGIRKGDRVLYLAQNSPECFALLLALAKIGGILAPVSPCSTAEELVVYCETCEPALVIFPNAPDAVNIDAIDSLAYPVQKRNIDELLSESTAVPEINVPDEETAQDDLFEIVFTSGTMSHPKAIEITHAHAAFACKTYIDALSLRNDDRLLNVMPVFHVDAVYMEFLPCITVGASLVLIERYSASHFIEQCARYEITFVNTVAMMIRTILMQKDNDYDQNNRLRLVTTFMQLSKKEREAFTKRFGVSLINCYGQSELVSPATMDPLFGPIDYDSVGSALPLTSIKIVDTEGNEVKNGTTGEICVKGIPGKTIMRGYFNDPQRTAKTIINESWLLTGDLGYINSDGNLYLVDRIKNIIKTRGENISAAEVEEVIREIPGIADVVVLGVPDDIYDEQVLAVIVSDSVTMNEIIAYCQRKLAPYKVPTFVRFVPCIPLTPTGKADRKKIYDLLKE